MDFIVYYYNGSLPLTSISSDQMSFNDLPNEGVVYVDIINDGCKHRLQGMDNYWVDVDNSYYGMFNNTGELGEFEKQNREINNHQEIDYVGLSCVAYTWFDEHQFIGSFLPTGDIQIIKGIMLSDTIAKELGIL